MQARRQLAAAVWFAAPFAVLVAAWAMLVPLFEVNPRLFPKIADVMAAAREGIADGSLLRTLPPASPASPSARSSA
jgi:taurine transport system permease protein